MYTSSLISVTIVKINLNVNVKIELVMNDYQESKLNMLQRVLEVLSNNVKIYAHVKRMVDLVAILNNVLTSIRETAQQQAKVSISGYKAEKQKTLENVIVGSIKIANVMYVIAFEKNDKVLLSSMSINKSMFYHGHANDVFTLATNIITEAKKYTSELREYGIEDNDFIQLEEAISSYENFINRPQIAKEERALHTKNLKELFSEADSILYDQIDKLIVLFKTSSPDFYFSYKTARNIINYSKRGRKEENEENEENTSIEN
jgi:hypothetical protein